MAFVALYRGVPFFTAIKPLMFRSFLAFAKAVDHGLMYLKAFLPAACCFFVTIFPVLLFIKSPFLKPPLVFVVLPSPRNTTAFARGPLAMKDTRFDFMTFCTFMKAISTISKLLKEANT